MKQRRPPYRGWMTLGRNQILCFQTEAALACWRTIDIYTQLAAIQIDEKHEWLLSFFLSAGEDIPIVCRGAPLSTFAIWKLCSLAIESSSSTVRRMQPYGRAQAGILVSECRRVGRAEENHPLGKLSSRVSDPYPIALLYSVLVS